VPIVGIWGNLVFTLQQLRHVGRNPPRLVFGEQFGRRAPAGLILEIDIGQLLPGVVGHDKAGTVLTKFSTWVFITEQTRLAEYCSVDMWCRFLETAHELGGDAKFVLAFSLFNSSTVQGDGKRRVTCLLDCRL
jgi:hypothetical protein